MTAFVPFPTTKTTDIKKLSGVINQIARVRQQDIGSLNAIQRVLTPTTMNIGGTATNDDAVAGNIGEDIESIIPIGSEVSLSTGVSKNITSIPLTPGNWLVCAAIGFDADVTTTITNEVAGISSTSATLTGLVDGSQTNIGNPGTGIFQVVNVGPLKVKIAANTTYYLVANSVFATSTMKAYGFIRAWRPR